MWCEPGTAQPAHALLSGVITPSQCDVPMTLPRNALDCNVCRCTGYQSIAEDVLLAAEARRRPRRKVPAG